MAPCHGVSSSVTNADCIFYWYIQSDITLPEIVHLSDSTAHRISNVGLSTDIQYPIGHVGSMYLILLGEPCNALTTYNPPNVRWDVLNNTMSQYYLRFYHIL